METVPRLANIVLVGAGGHALVVAESAVRAGFAITGFYDDDSRATLGARMGLRHLGRLSQWPFGDDPFIIALGDLALREKMLALLQGTTGQAASVVAPGAYIAPSATIGAGVFVAPSAVVHSYASVADHAIINTGAIVEHECEIGRNTHVAPAAALGGNVRVGARTLIGLGARVLPGIRIGEGCMVGAGAVVLRDVPDGEMVVGVPAAPPRAGAD